MPPIHEVFLKDESDIFCFLGGHPVERTETRSEGVPCMLSLAFHGIRSRLTLHFSAFLDD